MNLFQNQQASSLPGTYLPLCFHHRHSAPSLVSPTPTQNGEELVQVEGRGPIQEAGRRAGLRISQQESGSEEINCKRGRLRSHR